MVEERRDPPPQGLGGALVIQTVLSVGGIQVLSMAFGLVRSKIVAVTAGPLGVGAIGLIDQVVNLVAQICTFSLPYAAVKFLSATHSESREAFANLYVAFLRVLLLISLLGTGIGIILLWVWPGVLGRELLAYGGLVILGLLSIPASNLTVLLSNTMAAARRAHAAAIYGCVGAIALAILAGGGVVLDGLRGYYLGNLIGAFAVVADGILFLHKQEDLRVFGSRISVLQELRRHPQVLSFAGALYLLSFTSPLADLIARYAVLHSGGLRSAGLFQAAFGMALALRAVVRSSFAVYLMPTVNRTAGAQEKFQKTVEFIRALSVITGLMALPLVLFPELWLSLLYSPKFAAASPSVYVFVCAIIMQLFGSAAVALLVGLDHIGTYVMVFLAGDLATAAVSWWLVPILGFNGAGMAFLLDGVLVLGLTAWVLWSKYGMKMHNAMGSLPWWTLALLAVAGAAATRMRSSSLEITVAKVLVGLVLAGVMLAATRRGDGVLQGFWRLRRF